MNKTEKEVIRSVIRRLRCDPSHAPHPYTRGGYREAEGVRLALTGSVDPYNRMTPEEREREEASLGGRQIRGIGGSIARIYLNTWVIGALEALLDEEDGGTGRDLELARELSK